MTPQTLMLKQYVLMAYLPERRPVSTPSLELMLAS